MSDLIQRSLFEDNFLVRSIGEIALRPETAISELVSNAWDAGATKVRITIPEEVGGVIAVDDDGSGLDKNLFVERWMKLGYSRLQHQGEFAEFPKSRSQLRRKAYGRNGQGRHAMLCFSDEYHVDTLRDGDRQAYRFTVRPSKDESPFVLMDTVKIERRSHGCKVWATVERRLPRIESIIDSLSLTFLSDPNFEIYVNKERVTVDTLEVAYEETLRILDANCTVRFLCVPPGKKGRTGVAFWVGNRLVGEPSYHLFGTPLIDGRSTVAKHHFVVVQTDDLRQHVKPDWSGFNRSDEVKEISSHLGNFLDSVVSKLNTSAIEDTKKNAYMENREGIRSLTPLGKIEVTQFVNQFVENVPGINAEVLSAAIAAAVNLGQSRTGKKLLGQLSGIADSEIGALSRLLDEWTLTDAMLVLDEISRRSATIAAINKLLGDPTADELHTMHPLVAESRWLFGTEFDSPHFLSNITIRKAAEKVFRKVIDTSQIANPRTRPDLVFIKDATIGVTGVDGIDHKSEIAKLDRLLLVELKRGDAVIKQQHIYQACTYVQDFLDCGLLDGTPFISAYVVGHSIDHANRPQRIGEPEVATVQAVTYSQLTRTAERRLFGLSKTVEARFTDIPALELLDGILGTPKQIPLFDKGKRNEKLVNSSRAKRAKRK